MPLHIIDNKKINLTDDEWRMYNDICRSYDRQNFKGESLFVSLFESDDNGIITFLRPPTNRHTSMEVVFFMLIVQQHQQLRIFNKHAEDLFKELREKIEKLK
jgi:hypothetical protein